MAPKNNSVKIPIHELGLAFVGKDASSSLPSQSSGVERIRAGAEPDDWTRGDRYDGGRSDARRGRGNAGFSNGGFQDSGDDEVMNWRSGTTTATHSATVSTSSRQREGTFGNRNTEEDFSRAFMPPRSSIPPSSSTQRSSGFRMQSDFTRRHDADVYFSTAREGPRRFEGGGSPVDSRNVTGASRFPSSYGNGQGRDNDNTDDFGSWRGSSSKKTTTTGWVDPRPEHLRGKYRLRSLLVDSGDGNGSAEASTETNSTTPIPQSLDKDIALVGTAAQGGDKPCPTSNKDAEPKAAATLHTEASIADASTAAPLRSVASKKVDSTTDARQSPVLSNKAVLKDDLCENVGAVSLPLGEAAPVVRPAVESYSSKVGTASNVPVPSETAQATASSTEAPKKYTPWRPSRVRVEAQQGSAFAKGGAADDVLDQLIKQKQVEKEKALQAASQAPSGQANEAESLKAAYRRNLQEKEQRRREDEEKKRLAKLEAERLERLALERLMSGDAKKTQELQGILEKQLEQMVDPEALLNHFKAVLVKDDIGSLVPSIVIAKCLIREALKCLAPLSDSKNTIDLQRMEIVGRLVKFLKPTLGFVFSHSGIRRHKLRFLCEIQRFLSAMKFPRVSPGLSLIEALWDSLYMQDVIEEQYFNMWYDDTEDETPGRSHVLFQMLNWFNWLQSASAEGESSAPGPQGLLGEDSDEDDEDDL